MTFGISVGDFIAVVTLAKEAADRFKSAPHDFRETSKTVHSLELLLEALQNEVERPTSILKSDPAHAERFQFLVEACEQSLKRLVKLLDKYPSLGSAEVKVLDRIKFPKKTVLDSQQELERRYASLASFLNSVGLGAIGRIDHGVEETQRAINGVSTKVNVVQNSIEGVHGKINIVGDQIDNVHDSVAGVDSKVESLYAQQCQILNIVERMAVDISRTPDTRSILSDCTNDDKAVWRQLRRDLNLAGFKSSVIERHKTLIHRKLVELQQTGMLEWDATSIADDCTTSTVTFIGHPSTSYQAPHIEESTQGNNSSIFSCDGPPIGPGAFSALGGMRLLPEGSPSSYRPPAVSTVYEDSEYGAPTYDTSRFKPSRWTTVVSSPTQEPVMEPEGDEGGFSYFNPSQKSKIVKVDNDSVFLETTEGEQVNFALSSLSLDELKEVDRWKDQQSSRPTEKPSGIKGILKKPTEKFPECPLIMREGIKPLVPRDGIPPDARWTRIDRRLVNPEALEDANERFEESEDFVIVLRTLTRNEIQKLADQTKEIRRMRPSTRQ